MQQHLEQVGSLGIASRLRRLSDYFMGQVKDIYAEHGLRFDPAWFPLFSLLARTSHASITEAAQQLGFSHPHIIQLARQMEQAGLLSSKSSKTDRRSRVLSLTAKGKLQLEKLQPVWRSISRAVDAMAPEIGADLLGIIERAEERFRERSFFERVEAAATKAPVTNVKILSYAAQLKPHFERLNRQWLERYFSIEPVDLETFAEPEKKIIEPGGTILFAEANGQVAGTCALFRDGNDFELARMAVNESCQGLGIGNHLLRAALDIAKQRGARRVYLTTNSRLRPAVRLYEKFGFRVTQRGPHPLYKRADMIMELDLGA